MEVIAEVLKDLYTFAFKYRFGFLPAEKNDNASVTELTKAIQKITQDIDSAPSSPKLITPPEAPPLLPAESEIRFESIGYAYTTDTLLYVLPTRMFDGVITRLTYGESFQVLNSQGKWLNVLYKDVKGWIHMDDVTQSSALLHPKFKIGETYDYIHAGTIKLRIFIDDEFNATQLEFPLQDVEYVTYALKKKGMSITWPHERPRVAGTWQRLLRGVLGVHMGVSPKTDSVMEYISLDNTGHVCYVQSVYPDESFTVSEIGYPIEGVYNERTLSKEEWKELRPIFIEVA